MANALMFEVGIKSAFDKLQGIKKELDDFVSDYQKKLTLKVRIDNVSELTQQLSKIGDSKELRTLRAELQEVNRQFLQLSQGAGGVGDIASRGVNQMSEAARQAKEAYEKAEKSLASLQRTFDRQQSDKTLPKTISQKDIDYQTNLVGKLKAEYEQVSKSANEAADRVSAGSNRSVSSLQIENQSITSLTESVNVLTNAATALRDALGTWNPNKGSLSTLIEQFSALKTQIEQVVAKWQELIKLNQNVGSEKPVVNIGNVTGVEELNASVRTLGLTVNSVVESLGKLNTAVHIDKSSEEIGAWEKKVTELKSQYEQLCQQVKTASEANEQSAKSAKVSGDEEEQAAKRAAIAEEKRLKLLAEVENKLRQIANISASGKGLNPTLLSGAEREFEALRRWLTSPSTAPGKSTEELVAVFARLKAQYSDILSESDKYNKQSEKDFANAQRSVQQEIDRTIAKIKELDKAINEARGVPGRDITALTDARSRLSGQMSLLKLTTNTDLQDNALIEKRIQSVRTLIDDTERLLKTEKALTTAQVRANAANDKADMKKLNDEIKSVNEAWIKYNELGAKIRELQSLRDRGIRANIDVTQIDAAISKYHDLRQVMSEIINNNGRTFNGRLTSQVWGDHTTKKSLLDASADTKAYEQSLKDVEKRMRTAGSTADNLGKYLDNLEAKKVDFKGLDTSRLDAAIQRVRDIRAELERFAQTGRSSYGVNSNEIVRSMGLTAANKEIKDSTAELTHQLKQREHATHSAAAANQQLTDSEQRLANAIRASSESMKSQSQVLSDLKMMAMQYLSVWGAQSFVNSIIETGGQLEQQRLSMGAILQDAETANEIFGQIKQLAVQSPFGVVQLDQMSKQLAAYGFEARELFDWTKRLADISAATGTEVSRLALALGHVRSEGALSGYTLRQFSMGNVPLLRMLAENRGVSTKEIRDMVRKKEISDKEVSEILKQLTNEGGMFYQAQEVMSQALNARFKNLRDAFDIMYGEMAESRVGDVLKGFATAMTEVAKKWKEVGSSVLAGSAAFAIAKLAMTTYNAAVERGTASTLKSAMASKQKEAATLRVARAYRTLSAEEQYALANTNRLTAADIRLMLNEKKLTSEQLLRAVAMRKVNKETALSGVALSNLDKNQKRLIISQLQSINHTRRWSMLMATLGNAIRSAGRAMLAFGKMMLPMAAIGTVVGLITARNDAKQTAADTAETQADKLLARYKAANELRQELLEKQPHSSEEKEVAITQIVDALKEAGKYSDDLRAIAEGTGSVTDKYNALHQALIKVSNEYNTMRENLLAYLQIANDSGGGHIWFMKTSDNIMEDASDLTKSSLQVTKAEMELINHATLAQQALIAYYKSRGAFTKEMSDMEWNELYQLMQTEEERERFYSFIRRQGHNASNNDMGVTAGQAASIEAIFSRYRSALRGYWSDWEEIAQNDLPNFTQTIAAAFTQEMQKVNPNFSMKNATDQQKQEFSDYLDKVIGEWQNVSQSVKEKIKGETINTFWTVKFKMKPEISWLEEGMEQHLDFMKSNPFGYGFYSGNMTNFMNGKGEFYTLDEVQKWFGNIKPENAREGAEKLKKRKDEISKDLEFLRGITNQTEGVKQQIANLEREERAINAYGNSNGIDWSMFDKKNSGRGHQKDEELEMWKKRVSLLEKYRQEREALMKLMTAEQAEAKLREDGHFNALWSYFGDPNDYMKSLDEVSARLGTSGERGTFVDELGAKQGAEDLRQFKEQVSDAVSELSHMMSVMQENYDTYKKWVELTGDERLAARIAGVTQNSSYADWLRGEYTRRGGQGDADAFFSLSETQAKSYGKDSGLYKLWEEWQRNDKKIRQENLQLYEEAIKNAKGYEEKVDDIRRALERQKKAYKELGDADGRLASNAEKNANKEIAKLTWENFKDTDEWARVFGDLDKMSTGTLRKMLTQLRAIAPSIKDSTEATKAMFEAIAKVEKVLDERNPLAALSESMLRMSRLRQLRNNLRRQGGRVTMTDESAKYYGLQSGKSYDADQIDDELNDSAKSFEAVINKCVEKLNQFKGAIDLLASTFDALGMEGAASGASAASDILGGALSGASALSAFGPWGMAAGAALGLIGGIAKQHDASLQKQIEKMQDEVNALEANTDAIKKARARTLGYDEGAVRSQMANSYDDTTKRSYLLSNVFGQDVNIESAARKAMQEYYKRNSAGDGYAQELANLNAEREKYIDMYDAENSKKKKSKDSLLEYQQKIAELDDQIMHFTEDLANELWGIDVKSWADQLSDALVTAWENGEDAAQAFDDSVSDIMRNVVRNMLNLGIVEPMFEQLREDLFGDGGAIRWNYDADGKKSGIDWGASQSDALSVINNALGENGYIRKNLVDTIPNIMDAIQRQIPDIDLKQEDSSTSSASSTIKGVTEQTADLLASYVNAIRADVSVDRSMIAQYFPMYYAAMTSGNNSLRNIEEQARAIAISNDAIRDNTSQVVRLMNGLRNKEWKVAMA